MKLINGLAKIKNLLSYLVTISIFQMACQFHSLKTNDNNYIEIETTLRPIIIDSIDKNVDFYFKRDKPVVCGADRNQEVINSLPVGVKFNTPLQLYNLKSNGNDPENKYVNTVLINDTAINTLYHLKCWVRRIWRPNQPPPPPLPYEYVEINFTAKAKYKGYINLKTETFKKKSSTEQAFIIEYNSLPSSHTYSIERWSWTANVNVYESGQLVKHFPLSDKFPKIGKCSGEIKYNKFLFVEFNP